ncbi:ribosome recycling factor [Dactylococcopsis salina]|uniref:Ribosome-recycling factor n=1 Tax=Dactylococcopsis salina (strain PCC 8305) TaxID=13035 RepID=K9YU76_DACS8|nr:ribosome recycling factor [Dactylococcopsis salina]AFZ49658.1 ribosome recycling factor [Dactylococcopsis salina PCC 8305]
MKLSDVETKMKKAIDATQQSFNSLRTGRANASVLDRVMVEYYGMETPLKSLANISTPDATTITIQPYDKGSLQQIEKAISMSDIGLTPNNDGEMVRLNIPPLTSDRRQELVKIAGKYAEEGRVSIRNIRRDAIEEVRKAEKKHELSEDEARDIQDKIQKLTDKYVAKVDEILKAKEEDISTV